MSKSSLVLPVAFEQRRAAGTITKAVPDGPATQVPPDPEAEWDQRILQGLKRMDEDPEYRAAVRKRIS